MNMIFLVDGDNNIGTGLQGIDLLTADDTVLVFYGKGQSLSSVQKLCAGTKAQVQYLESVRGGKNSIDFQIITELGVLVGRGEADFAYVISQDKGYEAAMGALRARYADTFREVALRPSIQSCLQASFLLRSASREELAQALIREFGPAQGVLAYTHLEELFAPAPVPVPAPAEKPQKASGRRKRCGKGAKTPEDSQPESAAKEQPVKKQGRLHLGGKPAEEPQPESPAEEQPAKKSGRTHRSGRRRKKTAAGLLLNCDGGAYNPVKTLPLRKQTEGLPGAACD